MGPYAGVDYNLNLCPLQSRLQRIYHGQPYTVKNAVELLGAFRPDVEKIQYH